MRARVVSAASGAQWLLSGWRMFRAAPVGWIALVMAYWLIMTAASLVPVLGMVAASVLVQPFSLGFMAAARAASRGGPVELGLLFDGFRNGRAALIILGIVYFACLAAVLAASALADQGALARWMSTGARPDEAMLQSAEFLGALLAAALVYTPVMMAFWFAPPLAAWHSVGVAKALFFSFFACLMNWRAFLAYGVATVLATMVAPFMALTVLMLVLGSEARLPVAALAFPLLLVFMPILFASFYASYRDVFAESESP